MNELAATVADQWRKSIIWPYYDMQSDKASKTLPEYVFKTPAGVVPFTTITVNRSWRTAAHIDSGDLKQGFGVLCCLGDFEGCDLVFPRYKTAVRFREGDILLADVANQVHGNTPFLNPDGSETAPGEEPERIACVFYYQEKMEHCRPPDAEMKVINNWKRGQSTRAQKKKKS
jgi:2-oxoglutarate-Fe(II)-dependent dioxygenase family protein